MEFATFGDEKQRYSKLISKIHRYLKLNVASYVQKCLPDVKDPDEIKDPNQADTIEYLQKAKTIGKWFDFKTAKSSLFYMIGPIEDALCNQLFNNPDESLTDYQKEMRDQVKKDNQVLHIGEV